MLGGGCSQEGVQMLMSNATFCNVNALSTKQDCGTYPCHTQEEILILEGLNNVGRSLEPWLHLVIVMQ